MCQIKPHDSDIENRHSTSISDCGVWGVRVGIQVFRRKFHTHRHLDYIRVEFLSCIKRKKLKIKISFSWCGGFKEKCYNQKNIICQNSLYIRRVVTKIVCM